jgi:nucleoside-diphosphate-sugar epimerase
MTGSTSEIRFEPYSKAFDYTFEDMRRRVPDLQKIHNVIGYAPKVHLDEILRRVVDYWIPQTPQLVRVGTRDRLTRFGLRLRPA